MTKKMYLIAAIILGVAALMAVAAGLGLGQPAQAAPALQTEMPRTITVVGEGVVTTRPDIAIVYMGVQVSDPDVKMATQKASEQMEALLTALKNEGIADKDIQTSYYSVYVDRPYTPAGVPGDATYQVSNSVQVTVRKLDSITDLLGVAIENGANNINNIEFKLADPSKIRSEARTKAVDNAKARAEELAKLNDVAVGQVQRISEVVDSGAYYITEQNYTAKNNGFGGGGGPISPGDVTINVQLQITYAILQ
ncbi:MAG: hypothetical protein FOGNACKC_04477 [Anaerolineae bacterium]|nr:hypothetical protein [Anaerolineae bacterium]